MLKFIKFDAFPQHLKYITDIGVRLRPLEMFNIA